MLIKEAEVLNAYRAIYREISSYRAPWQARGYEREIADFVRYGAIARITAKYRGAGARHAQSRAPFHPGNCGNAYINITTLIAFRGN